jgi:hypothetical protein
MNVLVRLIYEAVNDPVLWDTFLTKFAESVRAETAGLLTQDKAGRWAKGIATVGVDAASRKSYEEYFVSLNPWLPRHKVLAGNVVTGEQILRNRELVRTEFYNDFLKPNHWLHTCSVVTNATELTFSSVFALHHPRDGAFSPDEIDLCWHLAPHLQTATRIRQRIVDLEATLDRLLVGEIDTKTLANLGLTPAETRLAIRRRRVSRPDRRTGAREFLNPARKPRISDFQSQTFFLVDGTKPAVTIQSQYAVLGYPSSDPADSNPVPAIGNHSNDEHQHLIVAETAPGAERLPL